MADVSFNDVQRAVQDGTSNLRAELQRLTNSVSNISSQAERIDDIERCMQDVLRLTQEMHVALAHMRPGNTEQRVSQVQGGLQELRLRFGAIEQFAKQMSDYIQSREKEDEENRRYKKA